MTEPINIVSLSSPLNDVTLKEFSIWHQKIIALAFGIPPDYLEEAMQAEKRSRVEREFTKRKSSNMTK